MGKINYLKAICVLFIIVGIRIEAQKVSIETKNLSIVDKKLEINYDILKAKKNQRFDVWVTITDSKGREIMTSAIGGDIGLNISGGTDKKIYWDYNADGLVIDDEIEVIVTAKLSSVTAAVSGSKCSIQSLLMPGMGLATVEKGKPFWIIGIVGYGALGSSIYLNSSSKTYYDKYKNTNDHNEATDYYNKSQKYGNISNVMAYTAVGTWSISLIWTIVKVKQHNSSIADQRIIDRFDVYSYIDINTGKPMIGFRYNF